MNSLLSELGKKIADRWLSALVLPGLLYVVAAGCGRLLGHHDALTASRLTADLERLGRDLNGRPAAIVLTVAGLLLAATAAGVAVQAIAAALRRVWTARRPHRWVAWRRRRGALARTRRGATSPERYLPARATPIGDRFRLVDERVDAQYGLSVALAWPRLWLLLQETASAMIRDAHSRYLASTETAAWGVLYLLLGCVWWPALVIGLGTVLVGHRRAHATGAALADLVEATVDTHQRQLAETLGIELPHGRITPAEGLQINDILNKRA